MHCILALVLGICVAQAPGSTSPFAFKEISPTGLQLSDGGKPVFVYNFGMVSAKGQPESLKRSSYLHPVYAPDGTLVTDDYNPNHPHHRGIFWAWPEVTVDGKTGDLWTIKGPFQDRFVAWRARETTAAEARLGIENGWFDGDRKFVKEDVTIAAGPAVDNRRTLDFTLRFEAVDRPVQIVGTSEAKKGFGGFCMRFATPDGGGAKTRIDTEQGTSAKDGVLARHPWAEISGVYQGKPAGARVEDDATNPGYPNNGWLMRHELCCLNVSYPGLTPVALEPGKPLVLKYRVVLFAGKDR
jgi:hypothetical protein